MNTKIAAGDPSKTVKWPNVIYFTTTQQSSPENFHFCLKSRYKEKFPAQIVYDLDENFEQLVSNLSTCHRR